MAEENVLVCFFPHFCCPAVCPAALMMSKRQSRARREDGIPLNQRNVPEHAVPLHLTTGVADRPSDAGLQAPHLVGWTDDPGLERLVVHPGAARAGSSSGSGPDGPLLEQQDLLLLEDLLQLFLPLRLLPAHAQPADLGVAVHHPLDLHPKGEDPAGADPHAQPVAVLH